MNKGRTTRWGALLLAIGLGGAAVMAGSFTDDFNSSSSTNGLNFGGTLWDGVTTDHTGSAQWVPDGGAGPIGSTANGPVLGVKGDGYLQMTFADTT